MPSVTESSKPTGPQKLLALLIAGVVLVVLVLALWFGKSVLCALTGGHYDVSEST